MQISRITSSMIHKHKIKLEFPYEKSGILKSFTLGNASVEILAQETHSDIINNKSIVMKVSYGDFSSLLMSDAQGEVEAALVEAQIDISADVLKVGHMVARHLQEEIFYKRLIHNMQLLAVVKIINMDILIRLL